ncbi:UNVERIFIED_CONTAM: hypothetical protein FKN15_072498 [Acipenser sinensis]
MHTNRLTAAVRFGQRLRSDRDTAVPSPEEGSAAGSLNSGDMARPGPEEDTCVKPTHRSGQVRPAASLGQGYGRHYITADSAFGGAGQKAVLIGPDLELLEWGCMRLVYQITGSGSLKMYVRPEGESFDYLLWSALDPSDSWLIASIDLRNTTNRYKIIFVASPGQKPEQSVAIFEILVVPGYCVECNFEEHHLCGYMNYWNPNVNWYVGGSTIRDGQSNLPFDHTMNNERGHYMYVDSVYAKHFQEVAQLTSPMTTTTISGCLSFYYQRDQAKGNVFSVFTRDRMGHYEEIWKPDIYAKSIWKLVKVDIKAPHPLAVVFEVAFNSAKGGYVAIDDISFSPEFCSTETEPFFDPSVANCDFEEDFCQYYQEQTEGSVWNRVSVKPNIYRVGDHTTGSGSFLLANNRLISRTGYVGRLYGPYLPGTLKYCLRFYYALHGFIKTDNTLAVYIYDENNVAQEKVWTVSESPMGSWIQVEVNYQKLMPTKPAEGAVVRGLSTGNGTQDHRNTNTGNRRENVCKGLENEQVILGKAVFYLLNKGIQSAVQYFSPVVVLGLFKRGLYPSSSRQEASAGGGNTGAIKGARQ